MGTLCDAFRVSEPWSPSLWMPYASCAQRIHRNFFVSSSTHNQNPCLNFAGGRLAALLPAASVTQVSNRPLSPVSLFHFAARGSRAGSAASAKCLGEIQPCTFDGATNAGYGILVIQALSSNHAKPMATLVQGCHRVDTCAMQHPCFVCRPGLQPNT